MACYISGEENRQEVSGGGHHGPMECRTPSSGLCFSTQSTIRMKYIFIFLTILSFMLMWVCLAIDDNYYAGLSALATGLFALIVTIYDD